MFFYSVNLTERTVTSGTEPWDFKLIEDPGLQVRNDKESRQNWYRSIDTKHHFYTPIEAANPNQRASKENPARFLHGFVADYDLRIPQERVDESVKVMPIKPAWIERSLGGNVRLVWTFTRPLIIDSNEFCCYVLQEAVKWLHLDLLPGLDEPSFTDPNRLFCNGASWTNTKAGHIPEAKLQSFFVKCGKGYRFNEIEVNVPLDVCEKALKEKYPTFVWPASFEPDTQGPTFWIPESTSPLSAILKKEGMFTFSAHAEKPFYSWVDLLGAQFVKDFAENSIAKATADIWWDGKRFWQRINGLYVSVDKEELRNYFKVDCRLSDKPGKEGVSMIDLALRHIYSQGRVSGAGPFTFRPAGLIIFMGQRKLNTYINKPILPATEETEWGPNGKFPFISLLLDNIFDPPSQRIFFLAWWKYFYTAAIMQTPLPGQNTFLMGGVGTGKTLINRQIVGKSVGGFVDATSYLIRGSQFNSEILEAPLWCVDDETMSESTLAQSNFAAMLKKSAANHEFSHNKKFEVSTMTEWMGRILCTTNLDYVSSRALGPMDNSALDKTNIFRCAAVSKIKFPARTDLIRIIDTELPFSLRWLLSWTPPEEVVRDERFGFKAYHETSLLEQAYHGSKAAPFKELLMEALEQEFAHNPEMTEWRGTVTQIIRMIITNPHNEVIYRSLRLEATARYLEMMQREGLIKCSVEMGANKTRVWIFPRLQNMTAKPTISIPTSTEATNKFQA